MHIPAKCRLAIDAMVDLALRQHAGAVPLSAISQRLQVSPSYLDLLFAGLRRAGLVNGTRGPGGGYVLTREATLISVADIVTAVETPAKPGTNHTHRSFTSRPARGPQIGGDWGDRLEQGMLELLAGIALEELVQPLRARVGVQAATKPRSPAAKGIGTRERMVVNAANSVFGRPLRLAI